MADVQGVLSGAQTFPVLGPVFVSPVKAGVSLIQIVGNVALAAIYTVGSLYNYLTGDFDTGGRLFTDTLTSLESSIYGWAHLVLAILNLLTLGIVGAVYNSLRTMYKAAAS